MTVVEPLLTLFGIAVPSLLIVLAVRRWLEAVPWRICALLFVIVLADVGPAVVSPDMPVALDEVARGYPYRGLFGPVTSRNPDTNDTVKQMLPWMQVDREEIFSRRVPLWNRYAFSGYPLLGNAQSAPFSPFFLLTLFVPLPKQIVAMAGVKIFVGLLFGYLLIRREGVSPTAAVFGSVIYSLSVFQNVYLYYPLSSVTTLLPAVCYAVLRVLDDGRWRSFVLLAIVVAFTLVAGHPESAAHVALAAVFFLILEWLAPIHPLAVRERVQRTALAAGGALTGVCLAAPGFFPVVELVIHSQRLNALMASRHPFVFPPTALWLLLNPDGFGNPSLHNYRWYLHYIIVAPSYIGLIPLTLLPIALFPGAPRRDRLLMLLTIVTFLLAMNWSVVGQLLHAIPPFSFAANDRLRFVMILFVAILSARAVERLTRVRSRAVLVMPLVVLGLAAYVFVKQFGITLSALSAIGIATAATFWLTWLMNRPSILPAMALIATAVELLVFNFPFNAMTPRKYYRPALPIIDAIRRLQPAEPFRIVGFDWMFLPNAAAQYGLEDIRGSDPMAWAPYIEFFRSIQVPGQSTDVARVVDVNHPAVRFLNVHFLLAEPNSSFGPPWRLVYRGKDGDLYRNEQPLSRFFPADGALSGLWLREINPQRFRMAIDAPKPLLIASSQPAAPGWIVKVNHHLVPMVHVNGAFIGFRVPAGKSQVSVEYQPTSFRIGVILFVMTIAAMIAYPYMSHKGMANSAMR